MRHCTARFACKVPSWRLPAVGSVAGLLAKGGEEVGAMSVAPCARAPGGDVVLCGNLGGSECGLSRRGFKRVRLSIKSPASEAFHGVLGDQPRSRVWKRLRMSASPLGSDVDAGRRQLHDHLLVGAHVQDTPPGLHGFH